MHYLKWMSFKYANSISLKLFKKLLRKYIKARNHDGNGDSENLIRQLSASSQSNLIEKSLINP